MVEKLHPEKVICELEEQGIVCVKSFLDDPTVEQMASEALVLLASRRDNKRTSFHGQEIFNDARFSTLSQVFGSNFFKDVGLGYNPASPFKYNLIVVDHATKLGKLTEVHFDMRRHLKFMIYLSDVYKENAAFRYCRGSHLANTKLRNRFMLMGGKEERLPNVPAPEEEFSLADMEGPRGTLIIFDTDGFHSAGLLQQGKERFLVRASVPLPSGGFSRQTLKRLNEYNPLRALTPLLAPRRRRALGNNLVLPN